MSFASEPMLWQGFILGACIALFGRLTHVASIAHNFTSIPLANVPTFVSGAFLNAVQGGELLTVLVSVFMIGLTLSFMYRAAGVVSGIRTQIA